MNSETIHQVFIQASQAENAPNPAKLISVLRRWKTFDPEIRIPESEIENLGDGVIDYIAGCLTKPGQHPNSGYPIMGEIACGEGDLRGLTILEVACGFGELANHLAQRGAVVVGVDVDQRMISAAQQAFGNNPNLNFIHGDSTDLREVIGSRTFNLGVCQDSTHHLRDSSRLHEFFQSLSKCCETVVVKDFDRSLAKTETTFWRLLFTNPSTVGLLADSLEAAFTQDDVREVTEGLPNATVVPAPDMQLHGSRELKEIIKLDPVPRYLDERFSWLFRSNK